MPTCRSPLRRALLGASVMTLLAPTVIRAQTQRTVDERRADSDTLVDRATQAPTPCAGVAERRRLDFWTGEWQVTTAGGSAAGSSSVQIVSGGCALLESWTSTRGGKGHSLTAFNPAVGQWQQYWIGQDGNPIEYRESTWHDGSIVLRASFAASGNTPAAELRLTFSPVDSTTVRQHGERSIDGGQTWSTTYDFLYHRRR